MTEAKPTKSAIRATIQEYGYQMSIVFDEDNKVVFAHSIGLRETYGHPELLFLGMPLDKMVRFGLADGALEDILDAMVEQIEAGTTFVPGAVDASTVAGHRLHLVPVDRMYYKHFLHDAVLYYGGLDFDALQVVWTDRRGKFPWERGFTERFGAAQPTLCLGQESRKRAGLPLLPEPTPGRPARTGARKGRVS